MLVAIISIYWITGTTDVERLYELGIQTDYQNLLWLAFFSSFAVKTPMWPVHTGYQMLTRADCWLSPASSNIA